MAPWPPEFTLSGDHVTVETLSQSHCEDLSEAAADGELHRLWYTSVPKPEGIAVEIDRRLGLREVGNMLPFAVIDKRSGRAVGMTTYMNIDAASRRLDQPGIESLSSGRPSTQNANFCFSGMHSKHWTVSQSSSALIS